MSQRVAESANASDQDIRIERVATPKQWQAFHRLKIELYQDDPAAAIPLKSMERDKLDVNSAFFAHAEREAWIGFIDGKCVGRIVAIVDRLHNEHHRDSLGFFGFFESVDDVELAKQLLDVAADWLRKKGCTAIRGPMSPSMKGEMGVLIEGFEHPPTILMAHSRPWYDALLRACELGVVKEFYAFHFLSDDPRHAPKFEKMEEFEARVMKRYPDLRFEQLSRDKFAETIHEVNTLGNEVRKVGWGNVPSTTAEIETMIKNLGPIIRLEAFQVAYYRDELVGYIIGIPDINWALRRTFGKWDWLRKIQLLFWLKRIPRSRIIALGADVDFRRKGIAMLLIKRIVDRRTIFQEWEMSWVLEDNVRSLRAIERSINLDRYKTWRIYEKPL